MTRRAPKLTTLIISHDDEHDEGNLILVCVIFVTFLAGNVQYARNGMRELTRDTSFYSNWPKHVIHNFISFDAFKSRWKNNPQFLHIY
jgi:hypothetical protein